MHILHFRNQLSKITSTSTAANDDDSVDPLDIAQLGEKLLGYGEFVAALDAGLSLFLQRKRVYQLQPCANYEYIRQRSETNGERQD